MKQVSLIGDSIRMHYQPTVVEKLSGQAAVWAPEGNCMHSIHHLFNLTWYINQPADVIHFNFGLWDCRRLGKDHSENAIPVDLYVRNLNFLLEKVRQNTQATLIWATITPVVQDRYNGRFTKPFEPSRVAGDVDRYNDAAAPVLKHHNVNINDLHAFVEEHGREKLISDDGIHYTDEGRCLLGERVAATIQKFL